MAADPKAVANTQGKLNHTDPNFPILYEDERTRVFKNPTNEIFVEDIRSGAMMRFSPYPGGLQFTTQGIVEPVQINNMIGWRVGPR